MRNERREREAKEAAERERLRKEAEAKKAEWWKRNGLKVHLSIGAAVIVVAAAIIGGYIYKSNKAKQAIAVAEAYIASGDSCVSIYHFDEAKKLYLNAYNASPDEGIRIKVNECNKNLQKAIDEADKEYNEALRKLKIFLDADDYEFNEYSNKCLDKMIQIYPEREETTLYKDLKDGAITKELLKELQKDTQEVEADYSRPLSGSADLGLELDMNGNIGTSDGLLKYDESTDSGYYTYYLSNAAVTRTVKMYSYEGEELILESYDKQGKYIGKFYGTITNKNGQTIYSGTFTNYKGASVKFNLKQ